MYTIVLIETEDGISGRVEDVNIAAQNTIGAFLTKEDAIDAMNRMAILDGNVKFPEKSF